jgi:hypothetical protein
MLEPLLKVNLNARAVHHVWPHEEINIFCFKFILPAVVLPASDLNCAEILEQSMGSRNRVGIALSYRPVSLCSLAGTTTRFLLGS